MKDSFDGSFQTHILLVDDDERIRSLMQRYLLRNGYLATIARDGAHARRLLSGFDFNLVILDLMMPGEDGLSLCRDLSQKWSVPVLLLTARAEAPDRITGLEAGADDYLTKPFEPRELLLRIKAILRRVPSDGLDVVLKVLRMGSVRYDIARGDMWDGNQALRLTATEAALMRVFSAKPGEVVSRVELVEKLSRDGVKNKERAVDVQITRLRRKIEKNPKQPRYLQTIRGAGYMLAPE